MEEILASIRRIIENNDAGEDRSPQAPSREIGDEAAPEEEMTAAGAAEPEAREMEEPLAPAAAASRSNSGPVSLAEVAARVRASGSSAALVRPSAPAAALASASMYGNAAVRLDEQDLCEDDGAAEMRPTGPDHTDFWPAPEREEDATAFAAETAPGDEPQLPREEAAPESELVSVLKSAESVLPTSVEKEPDEASRRQGEANGRRAGDLPAQLISASAGAKVAAAFGDLNEAFAAGPRRSFDEMAEEMLRPMLQQWLDDNLPTLVERLVREEIERVARGVRR